MAALPLGVCDGQLQDVGARLQVGEPHLVVIVGLLQKVRGKRPNVKGRSAERQENALRDGRGANTTSSETEHQK